MKRLLLVLLVLVAAALAWLAGGRETSGRGTASPGTVAGSHASAGEPALLRERDDADPPPSRTAAPSLPVRAASDAEASGPTTTVEVLGVEDAPLPGARVKLTLEDEVHEGVTGADGRIAFPTSVLGRRPHVALDAEGYFHSRTYRRPEELLTIRLHPVAVLAGRILDKETGGPIAGARVEFGHSYCKAECEPETALSGGDGSYRLERVPLGLGIPLLVSAEGYAPFYSQRELVGPGPVHLDLLVERGQLFHGTVEDLITGAPLPGVVLRQSEDAWERVVSDANGAFEGRFVLGMEVVIHQDGYCQVYVPLTRDDPEPLRLKLVPAVPITGSVRDVDGKPVSGALVRVSRDWAHELLGRDAGASRTPLDELPSAWRLYDEASFQARTDDEGNFETGGIIPWRESYLVSVLAKGYRRLEEPLSGPGFPGRPIVQDCVLVRSERGALVGRATLNGAPLSGELTWHCEGETSSTLLDGEGRFRLEDVPGGTGSLTLESPRLAALDFHRQPHWEQLSLLFDAEGSAQHDVELEIPLTSVAGTVTWSDGSPAVAAPLLVRGGSAEGRNTFLNRTTTREDGSFSVELARPEGALLVEPFPQQGYAPVQVTPGTEDLHLVLQRPGLLLFQVVDAGTGVPVMGYTLRVVTSQGGEAWIGAWDGGAPDEEGWRRASVAPGPSAVHVETKDSSYVATDFEGVQVASGGETRRVFELDRGLSATFVRAAGQSPLGKRSLVLLLEEAALGTVRVEFREDGSLDLDGGDRFAGPGLQERFILFDDAGRATVRGLRPGRYGFQCVPPGLRVEPAVIELGSGSTGPFELRWRME